MKQLTRLDVRRSDLTLRDLAAVVFRRRCFIVAVFLLIALGATAAALLLPDRYSSRMKILVQNGRADVVVTPQATNNGPASGTDVTESVINSEIELLRSKDILERVVRDTGMARDSEGGETPERIEKSVRKLDRDISIAPVRKANIIEISYATDSAAVLTRLADLYLEKHLALHRMPGTYEVFSEQAMQYQQELLATEGSLATFQRDRNVISLDDEKRLNLEKMVEAQASLQEAEAALSETTRRIEQLGRQLATLDPRVVTTQKVIPNQFSVERLNTLLVELGNKRTQLLTKYKEDDRLVVELDRQIKDTTAALRSAEKISAVEQSSDLNPLRQTLQTDLAKAKSDQAGLQARRSSLAGQVEEYRVLLQGMERSTLEHDDLARKVKELETNYQLYATKRDEARIADALDRQKITNVSVAEAPTASPLPATPNRPMLLALGLFLAAFASLGGAFGAELFRDTVLTPKELEEVGSRPVLATVPRARRARQAPDTTRARGEAEPALEPSV